ncbi:PEP-CTERM sorting domain-containing protein [Glaciimonas sp. GNP009]
MNLQLHRLSFLAGILLIGASQANAQQSYTFTDLGNRSAAYAINNAGQVAGVTSPSNGYYEATVWNGTTATSLGSVSAYAINNAGQVVGTSIAIGRGFIAAKWDIAGSRVTTTQLEGDAATAYAINDAGQVAGRNNNYIATVWNGTTATSLGNGVADAINNVGQVAGYSMDSNYNATATVWNGTTATSLGKGVVRAINNAGQMAGFSGSDWVSGTATIWNGTTATSLGSGIAYAINNVGQVVGQSYDTYAATLWNGTTATNLNSFLTTSEINAGWTLVEADGINDSGSIVGQAHNNLTNEAHAFSLIVSSVPEPETYAMLLGGLALIGVMVRRRKSL